LEGFIGVGGYACSLDIIGKGGSCLLSCVGVDVGILVESISNKK